MPFQGLHLRESPQQHHDGGTMSLSPLYPGGNRRKKAERLAKFTQPERVCVKTGAQVPTLKNHTLLKSLVGEMQIRTARRYHLTSFSSGKISQWLTEIRLVLVRPLWRAICQDLVAWRSHLSSDSASHPVCIPGKHLPQLQREENAPCSIDCCRQSWEVTQKLIQRRQTGCAGSWVHMESLSVVRLCIFLNILVIKRASMKLGRKGIGVCSMAQCHGTCAVKKM